jgi:hypothetical protein
MTQINSPGQTSSSVLGPALTRLSAKIAPFVQTEIVGVLIAELQRHFNEHLLPELHERVEAIVERGLAERIEAILARDLPASVESIIDRVLTAKPAQIYKPSAVVAGSVKGEYMTASTPLARDFLHPAYQEFCRIYNLPMQLHRKWWEYAFIYEHLSKGGALRPGLRGLGFGVGNEKLPSFFAGLGAHITATDAPVGANWSGSGTESDHKNLLFQPDMIDRASFDDRVSFEYCDMNNIPDHLAGYDFCWSSCVFEHLGSLQNGMDFVVNSVERSLNVGGIACHTTELNLSSDDETIETGGTVLYRKKDLEQLCATLEERGHQVEPLRIEPGTWPPDYFVDVPPYCSDPHLKLLIGSYVSTSVGIVARRGR